MTLRPKTIEIPFPFESVTLAAVTRLDFAQVTIPIPMTGSRVFTSVRLEVFCHDNVAATASLSERMLGIKLGSAAFDDETITMTASSSGEKTSPIMSRDVTAYFNANFGAGTSQTARAAFQYDNVTANLLYTNIGAKLVISFLYDDADASASTRVNLARIPLESAAVALDAAGTAIDTIPDLSTFLPEAGVSIESLWLEIEGNDQSQNTNPATLGWSLDAGPYTDFAQVIQGLNSAVYFRFIANLNPVTDALAAHTLNLRATGGSTRWNHVSVVVNVLYTYDHDTSTRLLVSTMLAASIEGAIGLTTMPSRMVTSLNVQEQAPTLVQSGAILSWVTGITSGRTLRTRFGGQSFRVWTEQLPTVTCGGSQLSTRLDAGSVGGSGHTLTRGRNDIVFDVAVNGGNDLDTIQHFGFGCARFLINYTCDKPSAGAGVCNETCFKAILSSQNLTSAAYLQTSPSVAIVDVTDRYISSIWWIHRAFWRSLNLSLQVIAEQLVGEGGPSWNRVGSASAFHQPSTSESSSALYCCPNDSDFKRYAGDPAIARFADPASARMFRMFALLSPFISDLAAWATSHAISTSISGNVTGYSGDGSAIDVDVYDAARMEIVAQTTTAIGGSWTATVWDDTVSYFARAEQDSTHVGSSASAAP